MKQRMKTLAVYVLTASCLAFTLPSAANSSGGAKYPTATQQGPLKKPDCKKDVHRSFCLAIKEAKAECASTYGKENRRKCINYYLAERFQPREWWEQPPKPSK